MVSLYVVYIISNAILIYTHSEYQSTASPTNESIPLILGQMVSELTFLVFEELLSFGSPLYPSSFFRLLLFKLNCDREEFLFSIT